MGVEMESKSYDGLRFRSVSATTHDSSGGPIGHYHQDGDVIWGEFSGGVVVTGRLTGKRLPNGVVAFSYCQLLNGGAAVAGTCTSVPEVLPDGRIRLQEHWRRDDGSSGISVLEQIGDEAGNH